MHIWPSQLRPLGQEQSGLQWSHVFPLTGFMQVLLAKWQCWPSGQVSGVDGSQEVGGAQIPRVQMLLAGQSALPMHSEQQFLWQ